VVEVPNLAIHLRCASTVGMPRRASSLVHPNSAILALVDNPTWLRVVRLSALAGTSPFRLMSQRGGLLRILKTWVGATCRDLSVILQCLLCSLD